MEELVKELSNEENKNVKVYFKGCTGIKNPVDVDGKLIKEGDILTYNWWYEQEMIGKETEKKHLEPYAVVKKHSSGKGLFGEGLKPIGITGRLAYLHDYRFKETKNLS